MLFSLPIEQAEHIHPQKILELVDNFLEDLLDQQYRKYSEFMVLDIFEEDADSPSLIEETKTILINILREQAFWTHQNRAQ